MSTYTEFGPDRLRFAGLLSLSLSLFDAGQAAIKLPSAAGLQAGPMHVPRTICTLHKGNNENSLELNTN